MVYKRDNSFLPQVNLKAGTDYGSSRTIKLT